MCNFDKALLHRYIDHDLDPLEKILLEKHLMDCSECRRELNNLKILEWDLNNIELPSIPKELASIRAAAIDAHFMTLSKEASFERKNVLHLQFKTIKKSVSFINYLPGKKFIQDTIKKTTAKYPKKPKNKSLLSRIVNF